MAVAGASTSYAARPGPKLPGDVPGTQNMSWTVGEVCPFAVSVSVKEAHNWSRGERPE
jgi:hypothetical protein